MKEQHQYTSGSAAFAERVYLASPTMHREELSYLREAIETNWVSTVGKNIDCVEAEISALVGKRFTVGLASGTAALHMAVRACAVQLYGMPSANEGALAGKRVFCSDLTFAATVNPVLYEGGEPVLIDSEYETWNMDPDALERAFVRFPEVKLVILVHLYGTPAQTERIRRVCDTHGALLIEDAAESLGSSIQGRPTGAFGDVSVISFNGNKIVTGSSGGALLTDQAEISRQVRKWSTQSRDQAPWYQHSELGYNHRMSNLIAGVIRGQLPWLEDHMARKTALFQRYAEGFRDLPLDMNPVLPGSVANHWLSCLLIRPEAMCPQTRTDSQASYEPQPEKTCPTELLEALAALNAEGRPIWKPMHLQPLYGGFPFVNADGDPARDAGADIFRRGLCLPSDIKMTEEQQKTIIQIIRHCFTK